jgi:ribosomal protein S18 acetylase RimI-like enzyme
MIQTREFEARDAPALATVMLEMVAFYGRPLSVQGSLEEDIIRQAQNVKVVVAVEDGTVCGFATYGFLYPVAGLQSFAYLQQIYVAEAFRRRGVAEGIMSYVAKSCLNSGCNWMEWTTSADNIPAQRFYEGLGATSSQKVLFEISGAQLRALASRVDL